MILFILVMWLRPSEGRSDGLSKYQHLFCHACISKHTGRVEFSLFLPHRAMPNSFQINGTINLCRYKPFSVRPMRVTNFLDSLFLGLTITKREGPVCRGLSKETFTWRSGEKFPLTDLVMINFYHLVWERFNGKINPVRREIIQSASNDIP